MKSLLPLAVLICLSSALTALQTNPEEARNQLNQGVQAYKQAQYESAVEHFRQARTLDPESRMAALYLATALLQQYIPGVNTPENLKFADEATESYKQVLVLDPKNVTALKGLASLALNLKRFEDAKSYYRQVVQIDPNDPEAFYSVGVVDWTQAYKHRADERSKWGLPRNDLPSTTQSFCPKLRADNLPLIEDGMQVMKRAIELRPDYDDAMVYMNLLFRESADVQCGDEAARSNDERQAEEWADKAMQARRERAKKATESQQPPQNQ